MHYTELHIYALDLYSNSLNHFIWKRLKVTVCGRLPLSRYANTWLDDDDVSVGLYCALLASQWKTNLRSTSVQLMNTWPLGYSITRLESQNRKFAPILIITGPKSDHFFVCKQTGFVDQRLWDFAKMTLTRVSSHWLWLESSHSVKNVTRVELNHHLSQRDSSRVRVTKNRESSHWIQSRYYWLAYAMLWFRREVLFFCHNLWNSWEWDRGLDVFSVATTKCTGPITPWSNFGLLFCFTGQFFYNCSRSFAGNHCLRIEDFYFL